MSKPAVCESGKPIKQGPSTAKIIVQGLKIPISVFPETEFRIKVKCHRPQTERTKQKPQNPHVIDLKSDQSPDNQTGQSKPTFKPI
jgi:hypothetical protein